MKILAVDTALGACSVAVVDGDAVRAHRLEAMDRGHAEALAPMVQAVMREATLEFSALERLAVTTGPGTFTGQRVGLAFMRGLRIALKLPLIGLTTLEAMAAEALHETGTDVSAVLHDAKRGEVYVGLFTNEEALLQPELLRFEDAVEAVRQETEALSKPRIAFAGTAGPAGYEYCKAAGLAATRTSIVYPDAPWVARLGRDAPESSAAPRPLYLRPPDARLPAKQV